MTAERRTSIVRVLLAGVLLAGLMLGGFAWDEVLAQAPWSENFDSYAAGSQMIGQGGWTGWDNNPAVGALVSNAFQRSNPNSVAITGPTDLVHTYAGYTSGRAVYTAWQYIPNTFSGTTYFIMMNQYNVGGAKNWSVQVHFESASGRVASDFDGNWLPIILGRWVQIRVEINLDTDTQTFYYDNTPLYTKSWRCGVSGCGPLPPNVAAVDLYAYGASPVYYDDLSLDHALPTLALAKTITSGNPYSTVGGLIGYSYVLTNTGNVALFAPYGVVDDKATPTCPAGPASLAPGGTVTCTASHMVTQADLNAGSVTNTATATAKDAAVGGNAVTSNSSSQTATATQNRRLSLAKSITSGNPYSVVGGTINYSYAVLNSGNISLAGPVTVSDSLVTVSCPNVNTVGNLDAFLDPGESLTCTASHMVTQADLNAGSVTNTATASAGGTTSNTDSQTATAIQTDRLTLVKSITSGNPYDSVGDVINYSFVVTNTGNVSLDGPVTVADDRSTDETCPAVNTVGDLDGYLDPGESLTCTASHTVTQADLDAGSVTNIAAATSGTVISPTDTETATAVQSPGIQIVKEVSVDGGVTWQDANTPPGPSLASGTDPRFHFVVTNTGNVPLGAISLSDTDISSFFETDLSTACSIPTPLAPAATFTCFGTLPWAPGLHADTATASGDFGGSTYSDTDDAYYLGTSPGISDPSVTKSADPATAAIGDTVIFTLVVTNTGPGDAEDVEVIDIVPSFLTVDSVLVTAPLLHGGVTVDGNTITIEFGTVTPAATCPPPSGTSCYIVTIRTTVNSSATPPGGTNTATLDTSSADSDPSNNTASALITIGLVPGLGAPETGFAPGQRTLLPVQPHDRLYQNLGDLWLEIPSLGVRTSITGVPLLADGWDVTWLGDLAGYLEGTAFPTWSGNSVITGHVTLRSGLPGPFARLQDLGYGDQIIVHAWGMRYIFEVREAESVSPHDQTIFRHEERSWITLLTCEGYDERSGTYRRRHLVRAVLMRVEANQASSDDGGVRLRID